MPDSQRSSPSILRRVINKVKRKVDSFIPEKTKLSIQNNIARSQFFTAFYYYINGTYYLEQRSVLLGLVFNKYQESRDDGFPIYTLIRNTHRLEKGLGVKNRKATFAEGYVLETVKALEKINQNNCPEEGFSETHESLAWSIDVLSHYFDVVQETEIIQKSKDRFRNILNNTQYEKENKIPYKRGFISTPPVRYEAFEKLANQRRSIRWYLQQPVPRNDIDRAIKIASQSPSACNRQAFEFLIYDDKELILEIGKLAPGASGFRENIPCLVVLVGKLSAYFDERDRHIIYIDGSLAAMAFQFALETLSISSTCINWPSIPKNDEALNKLLNLSEDRRVIMLISVGFADPEGLVLFSQKKSLDMIRSYNKK